MPALQTGFDTFSIEILVLMLMYFHSELSEQALVTEVKITDINQKGTPLSKSYRDIQWVKYFAQTLDKFTCVSSSFQDGICSTER